MWETTAAASPTRAGANASEASKSCDAARVAVPHTINCAGSTVRAVQRARSLDGTLLACALDARCRHCSAALGARRLPHRVVARPAATTAAASLASPASSAVLGRQWGRSGGCWGGQRRCCGATASTPDSNTTTSGTSTATAAARLDRYDALRRVDTGSEIVPVVARHVRKREHDGSP